MRLRPRRMVGPGHFSARSKLGHPYGMHKFYILYANRIQNPSFSCQRTDKLPEKDTPSIAGKNSGFHAELSINCRMSP